MRGAKCLTMTGRFAGESSALGDGAPQVGFSAVAAAVARRNLDDVHRNNGWLLIRSPHRAMGRRGGIRVGGSLFRIEGSPGKYRSFHHSSGGPVPFQRAVTTT